MIIRSPLPLPLHFTIKALVLTTLAVVPYASDGVCVSEPPSDELLSSSLPSCLLQNHFSKDNIETVAIDLARPTHRHPLMGSFNTNVLDFDDTNLDSSTLDVGSVDDGKISLFEMQSSLQATSSMMRRAKARCQRYQAHAFMMRRSAGGLKEITKSAKTVSTYRKDEKLEKSAEESANIELDKPAEKHKSSFNKQASMKAPNKSAPEHDDSTKIALLDKPTITQNPEFRAGLKETKEKTPAKSTKSLGELIDAFVDSQAGSEDACHSQLLEARHQLNQLHALVLDLVEQVNSTEASLIIYDKELQEKLQELMELEQWKEEGLKKCKKKKKEDIEMLKKLNVEMEEMIQIANPGTAMNVSGRTVSNQETDKAGQVEKRLSLAEETDTSLLQTNHEGGILRAMMALVHSNHRNGIPLLLQATHSAAKKIARCANHLQRADGSFLQESTGTTHTAMQVSTAAPTSNEKNSTKAPSKEECEKQKEELETTYVKAYVALSRLKAEYEVLVKSTACEDPINVQYQDRSGPLQKKSDKLSTQSMETAEDLKELKPHLDKAQEAENKLRKQVETLSDQCGQLGPTISDLDKVRNAIEGLSLCPGLGRVEFHVPEWTGKWATFSQNSKTQDDNAMDQAMKWACNRQTEGSRPAEVGEIQERTILHMPENNTAAEPLVGTCPECAGKDDKSYKSGHARICWEPGKPLDVDSQSDTCGQGRKVIICVLDNGNMRKVPSR